MCKLRKELPVNPAAVTCDSCSRMTGKLVPGSIIVCSMGSSTARGVKITGVCCSLPLPDGIGRRRLAPLSGLLHSAAWRQNFFGSYCIYASLTDSMVASVIKELSPKDERTKLLREKLAFIQEAQVSAVSAGFAAASNLQLLRHDALLKNFGFQPQVLSTVRTAPFEGSHVLGPEPKVLQNRVRTIRQADRMAGSSVTFTQKHHESKSSMKATSSRKTASRTSVFDRLGSPTAITTQRTVTQEPPFRTGAGRGARHRPYPDSRKKSGKSSAASSTRQRRWVPGGGSPGRLCPALVESAGQLPGHQHCWGRGGHCIPATTSAHPSVHQLPDQKQPVGPPASRRCLAAQGSHRAGHQRDIPRVLQPVVPGPQEDRRSATCDRSLHSQPPHGSSAL